MLFTRQIMIIGTHLTTKKKLLQNDVEYRLYKCQHGLETSASEKRKNQSENYLNTIIFHFPINTDSKNSAQYKNFIAYGNYTESLLMKGGLNIYFFAVRCFKAM